MMRTRVLLILGVVLALTGFSAPPNGANPIRPGLLSRNRPVVAPTPGAVQDDDKTDRQKELDKIGEAGDRSIEFKETPLELVFKVYGELTNKTIIKDPAVPSCTITLYPLKGQELTDEEKVQAIETVLEMNKIHMEPYGDKFVRALPRGDVRKEGIPLIMDPDATPIGDSAAHVISLMIPFKNIAIEEAQKALEGFKSATGILLVFERTNSILVTDTEVNVKRMLQIARTIDIATPVLENVFVRQIKNASAEDVKTALESIVEESQKELEKNGTAVNQSQAERSLRNSPASRLLGRNNQKETPPPASNESLVTSMSDADRGLIRGKVLILADERSNKLIIVTMKSNMDFFDKVIEQLDVETTPDTVVKVYRLKYADAEDASDMINDLIGNASSSKSSNKGSQNANSKNGSGGNLSRGNTSSQKKSVNQRSGEAKAGELSKDNTTVLADKRINGLVVMTEKELVPTIESIIESMDIKLSQVLIETAIIEVTLGDNLSTGIDWVRTGRYRDEDGNLVKDAFANGNRSYASMMGGGGGTGTSQLENLMNVGTNAAAEYATSMGAANPIGSGLNYIFKSDAIDLAAVIQASKTDSRSKYIASPIVMTVDNKEATINATDMTYLLKGFTSSGNSYSTIAVPDYEQKELGIEIKTTPKINPNGTVMLEVETKYTQKGANQTIKYSAGTGSSSLQDVSVPTTSTREMSADVLLENMQTVILGGLTDTYTSESETGIPLLKDIPYIGKWLFGSVTKDETRKELLIFMTPYVISDGDQAEGEAGRRLNVLSDSKPWDDHGWSKSKLAAPVSKKEQLRRLKDQWKMQDEERTTNLAIEKAKVDRVEDIKKMSAEERDAWLKMHEKDLKEEEKEKLEEKMEKVDPQNQEELKKLAQEIRKEKLGEANKELKANEELIKAQQQESAE